MLRESRCGCFEKGIVDASRGALWAVRVCRLLNRLFNHTFMKKLYFAAIAGMLLATACSNEDNIIPDSDKKGNVSFDVMLPSDLTRADLNTTFGSGEKATQLKYMVYQAGENTPLPLNVAGDCIGIATFTNLRTRVVLNLPRGKNYDIVFWAQNPDTDIFSISDDAVVTVNYAGMTEYTEDYDAFCFALLNYKSEPVDQQTVTLYRPFAQLNVGTSDYVEATNFALDASQTRVSVSGVYTKYDLRGSLDGRGDVVEESMTTVQMPFAPLPAESHFFPYPLTEEGALNPNTPYRYLTMNWLFVPATATTSDVRLQVIDADYDNPNYYNVPLQRNHRTNLFGKMLTCPADFNVVINEIFEDPSYDHEVNN